MEGLEQAIEGMRLEYILLELARFVAEKRTGIVKVSFFKGGVSDVERTEKVKNPNKEN